MRVSVIIPAHNEQDNISEVINKIERQIDFPFELVVVDDHSTDATSEIVTELSRQYSNIKLVENKLSKGFANALNTGFNNATTELVVAVMGDLCDDLSTVKKMLTKIDEGYDIVCASRYIEGGRRSGGSKMKGFLSCLAGWSLYYLLGVPTHDIANAFKMYRKRVIDNIKIKSKGFEVSMEIPLKAYFRGYKITEVPTLWSERTRGKSSFKLLRLLPDYLKSYIWAIFRRVFKKRTILC